MNYLVGILCSILTALVAFGFHKIDVARLEAKQTKALAAQEKQLNDACDKAQQITEGVSRDYQEQLSTLGRQLDTLKRVRTNPKCVPIASTTAGYNGRAGERKPIETHGISTEWAYDFAAEGEKYRLQLIACQDFIKKERE